MNSTNTTLLNWDHEPPPLHPIKALKPPLQCIERNIVRIIQICNLRKTLNLVLIAKV